MPATASPRTRTRSVSRRWLQASAPVRLALLTAALLAAGGLSFCIGGKVSQMAHAMAVQDHPAATTAPHGPEPYGSGSVPPPGAPAPAASQPQGAAKPKAPAPSQAAPPAPPPMAPLKGPAPQPQPVLTPRQPDYGPLQADLAAVLGDYGRRGAVFFEDLRTGRRIVIAGDERFHPASTVKVPLVVALFEGAQQGKWSLDDEWAISADDWEDGAGDLQAVPAGTQFTLRELARLAIVDSDNIAASALGRRVGWAAVRDSMRQAGATLSGDTLTSLSVTDMGAVLSSLARRQLKNPAAWQPLMDWLSHTSMNDWLPARLPAAYTAYHKWGAYGSNMHDAGIVAGPGARYVLVVYTDGTKDGAALIRAVSARVVKAFPAPGVK